MTKRSKKSSSSGSRLTRQILYLIILIILAGVVYLFDIDLDELTNPSDETPQTTGTGNGSAPGEVVQTPAPSSGDFYDLYFTNVINSNDESRHHGAPVEQALIAAIDGAQKTIDAALFELNLPDVTAALVRAAQRGVTIRMVADDEHNFEDPESTVEEVIDAGAQVISDERSALMHNKYFIIDGVNVWTGSMNITRNGVYNNNNNAIYFKNVPALAQNYQNDFDEMFVDKVFTRSSDSRPVVNRSIMIGNTEIETYFSPEDGNLIESRLTELATASQTSIRVMAFSFTLDSIGNAMIERFKAGVTVEGVMETTGSLQGEMTPLLCAGISMRQDGNPDILHHKVFIFDNQIVAMGSFNFSASARDNNSENMLIIHNADIAAAFTAEWQARFNEGRVPPAEDVKC